VRQIPTQSSESRALSGASPDPVTGIATNTAAGIDLVEKLTDCSALSLREETATLPLERMRLEALPE